MDSKEIDYKLKELRNARKYYEDQTKYHYSKNTTNERDIKKHEQDLQMLDAINQSINSLENAKYRNEDAYVVVSDGFNPDNLSKDDKKEYKRLKGRVDNAEDRVFYHGGDRKKLDKVEL